MQRVAIVVPVLGRPHRIGALLDNVAATTTGYRVLFVANESDRAERDALGRADADHIVVPDARRSYPCKINDGIRASDEPLVFTAADDVVFHPGWLDIATAVLSETVDVVGTRDLLNPAVMAGEHSTHTLVRRSYVDRYGTIDQPGVLLHEGYEHEYCDDELIRTARARGRFATSEAIVEHLHPWGNTAAMDNTYRLGRATRDQGRRLFASRKPLWERVSA